MTKISFRNKKVWDLNEETFLVFYASVLFVLKNKKRKLREYENKMGDC